MIQSTTGETWHFEVDCPGAERVYLVREVEGGSTAWIEMQHQGSGRWQVQHRLIAGRYRFRYFRADGTTYLNCGDHGLTGRRVVGADPTVDVADLQLAASA